MISEQTCESRQGSVYGSRTEPMQKISRNNWRP